jgi:glycosyltransferase involved in cell wall biosynthesis
MNEGIYLMREPKVSVIVPIYNSERFLKKCIESILMQSYKNLEIILVNDGSTDLSARIIDEYAIEDNRIIAIHKSNGGIGTAYQAAFDIMSGEYISFIDSDDYVHLDMYKTLIDKVLETDADIIQFGMQYVDMNYNYLRTRGYSNNELVGNDKILMDYLVNINSGKQGPHLTLRFAKQRLFEGCSFLSQSQGMDEITTLKILKRANKLVFIEDVFYYCLERPNSVGRMPINSKKFTEQTLVYKELISLLDEDYKIYPTIRFSKYLMFNYPKFIEAGDSKTSDLIYKEYLKLYRLIFNSKEIKQEKYRIRISLSIFYYLPNALSRLYNLKGLFRRIKH